MRHLNFVPPPPLNSKSVPEGPETKPHSISILRCEGRGVVSQFLLLIVWIYKKKIKKGVPLTYLPNFFEKTSQIAAEIAQICSHYTTWPSAISDFAHSPFFDFVHFTWDQNKKTRQNSNFSLKLKHLEKVCWFLKGNCATVGVNEGQTEIWLSLCLKIQYSQ